VARADYKRMLSEAVEEIVTWQPDPDPARLEAEIRALRAGAAD
jgi:hypothetical protein